MITSDMINFIRHDLSVFGLGVLCFLILMLEIFFRKARWVFISVVCCFATVLFMFGFIGLVQWRVTVVSSNFTSLLLIITLSLTVHLIVRYHELYKEHSGAGQYYLISETMKSKAVPSIYTCPDYDRGVWIINSQRHTSRYRFWLDDVDRCLRCFPDLLYIFPYIVDVNETSTWRCPGMIM